MMDANGYGIGILAGLGLQQEGIYSDYSKDVIRPSAQECAQNGRARSTKMRWAIKSE